MKGKRSSKGVPAALIAASVREVLEQNPENERQFAAMIAKKDDKELLDWLIGMIANEDMPDEVQPKERPMSWRLSFGIIKAECLRRMSCVAA